jgi:phosphoribosylamine--glycine ligase/phosphoribosylformylglycinamidine cyclo-ligase
VRVRIFPTITSIRTNLDIEADQLVANIPCFAPTKEAAQLEGSKAFSKDFMARHGIPTAEYQNFTDYESAKEYVKSISRKVVIKASGLAAGKGVVLPETPEETLEALKNIMLDRKFGAAGAEVVIEEFLEGDELSILTFSDGITFKSLPPAQDHKRIFDGDFGPNTGGMGCYAPIRIASQPVLQEIDERILKPTFDGLRKEGNYFSFQEFSVLTTHNADGIFVGIPFVGLLFTGIILTKFGPKALEYNARFGDPETQTLLPLISKKTDLAEIMMACVEGRLHETEIVMDDKSCAVVVIASGGYPGPYSQGKEIEIKPRQSSQGLICHCHWK